MRPLLNADGYNRLARTMEEVLLIILLPLRARMYLDRLLPRRQDLQRSAAGVSSNP